jgi:hypothetical protein
VHLREQLSHRPKRLHRALTELEKNRPAGYAPTTTARRPSKSPAAEFEAIDDDPPYNPQTKLQPTHLQALAEAYAAGATIQQLARDHHLHRRTAAPTYSAPASPSGPTGQRTPGKPTR